jgi:hypothetical protein
MYKIFWLESLKGRELRRPRRTWENNNIGMDVRKIVWMHVAQVRDQWQALVNKVRNLRIP